MLARTVPATVATCGYFTLMIMLFLGGAIEGSGFSTVASIILCSTLVVLLTLSVPTVMSLRRHPELVKQPHVRPLRASTARLLWVLGGACILLSLGCVIAYRATDSDWFRAAQSVASIGGMIAFNALSRRPMHRWSVPFAQRQE